MRRSAALSPDLEFGSDSAPHSCPADIAGGLTKRFLSLSLTAVFLAIIFSFALSGEQWLHRRHLPLASQAVVNALACSTALWLRWVCASCLSLSDAHSSAFSRLGASIKYTVGSFAFHQLVTATVIPTGSSSTLPPLFTTLRYDVIAIAPLHTIYLILSTIAMLAGGTVLATLMCAVLVTQGSKRSTRLHSEEKISG
jgi:hypothetical protein